MQNVNVIFGRNNKHFTLYSWQTSYSPKNKFVITDQPFIKY